MVKQETLLKQLRVECSQSSQYDVAAKYKITQPYLNQILNEVKPLSRKLATAMGYRIVYMYEKTTNKQENKN